jgi:integrase
VGADLDVTLDRLTAGRDGSGLILRSPRGGRLHYNNFNHRHWRPAIEAAMRCERHPPEGLQQSRRGNWPAGAVSTCDCPERLKRRPTIHDLRHTSTAWLIAEGRQIAAISRRLGHSSTAVTERVYAGILPSVDDDMAAAMDRARRPAGRKSAGRQLRARRLRPRVATVRPRTACPRTSCSTTGRWC